MTAPYTPAFYAEYQADSARSARRAARVLMDLVRPESVVDVGCGIGTWLRAFHEAGVRDIVGVDGEYVDLAQLLIPADRFVAHDLRRPLALPEQLPQTYDLALSLEVGEHLPADAAGQLVASLVALAPVVAFSAAIPGQGGTDHINEQWPTFWAGLFARHGYRTVDALRDPLWGDPEVAYYYAQNALLYVREDALAALPHLAPHVTEPDDPRLCRVHPAKWEEANDPRRQPLKNVLRALPHAIGAAARRRLRRD